MFFKVIHFVLCLQPPTPFAWSAISLSLPSIPPSLSPPSFPLQLWRSWCASVLCPPSLCLIFGAAELKILSGHTHGHIHFCVCVDYSKRTRDALSRAHGQWRCRSAQRDAQDDVCATAIAIELQHLFRILWMSPQLPTTTHPVSQHTRLDIPRDFGLADAFFHRRAPCARLIPSDRFHCPWHVSAAYGLPGARVKRPPCRVSTGLPQWGWSGQI